MENRSLTDFNQSFMCAVEIEDRVIFAPDVGKGEARSRETN
jgi:hypothetical protein